MQWCARTIHTTHWTPMATQGAGRCPAGSSKDQAWSQSRMRLVLSQSPHSHWVEQGQVLRPFDGQLPGGVVVDDFRDAVERGAVLTQNILLFGLGQFHVHEALVALEGEGVVVFAGLTIPDKVATLLTESQQILGIASADGSMIPYLFLQWNGGIHSLSQNPTELRAPVFDGLEASSRSTELAPSVPRR